jgi:hypothetical protein
LTDQLQLFFDGHYLSVNLWEGVLGGLFDGIGRVGSGENFASSMEVPWVRKRALLMSFHPFKEFETIIPH